jgi:hypothetical protein
LKDCKMSYKFGAMSPSDPSKNPLKYAEKIQAELHCNAMNALLEQWDTNSLWNKDFWKSKPEPWEVLEIK